MTTHALPSRPTAGRLDTLRRRLGEPALRLREREPRLFAFAMLMWALMIPAVIALGIDERTLRGVEIWVKPLKFMASVGLLALTTAWFVGHLPAAVRRGRSVSAIAWTVIATGGFEVAYITLQAALGQASHYNVGDAFHGTMYTLMAIGAMALTATQPALGWLVWKHGDRNIAPAYRLAVILGLALTFALGASVGMVLGGQQPPAGAGLPLVGWSTTGGDLRVAHFVGIHASQVLPLVGALSVALRVRGAAVVVWVAALGWTALWAVTFGQALLGRPLIAL
jgi:hypothetical protein